MIELDEWGHVASKRFPGGALGGVIERPGGARIVLSRSGDPTRGYDRVWWYETVEWAMNALDAWDFPGAPEPLGYTRDLHEDPIEDW